MVLLQCSCRRVCTHWRKLRRPEPPSGLLHRRRSVLRIRWSGARKCRDKEQTTCGGWSASRSCRHVSGSPRTRQASAAGWVVLATNSGTRLDFRTPKRAPIPIPAACPDLALLWLGYRTHPDAFLLPSDKQLLNESPFFALSDLQDPLFDCTDLGGALDTTPPLLHVSLSRNVLAPPNNKLVPVTATVHVSDNHDPNPVVVLDSITSSEADDGLGDGATVNDVQGAGVGNGRPALPVAGRAFRPRSRSTVHRDISSY